MPIEFEIAYAYCLLWTCLCSCPHKVRWRAVNAPHLVALVRAGARFERGQLMQRQTAHPTTEAA
jgi:hypothetical protein